MINIQDSAIFNAILQVERGGKIPMQEIETVIWYLRAVKEELAAKWVENNRSLYLQGVLSGFKNEVVEIKNIVNQGYPK